MSTVLTGLTALATLAGTGCVINDTEDSAFRAFWSLEYVGGGSVGCGHADVPEVSVVARHLGNNSPFPFKFPCDEGAGMTSVLPLGQYEVTLSALNSAREEVSRITGGPWEIRRHGITDLTPPIVFEVQSWSLTWAISRNLPGGAMRPAGCAEVGAKWVRLITQLGNKDRTQIDWPCEGGAGVSGAIQVGSYGAQVALLDAAQNTLSSTQVMNYPVNGTDRATLSVIFDVR
jgi:hypothetical protein